MSAGLKPAQEEVLELLLGAWPERRIVLIGAAALGMHLEMTWRETFDVDLTLIADAPTVASDLKGLGFERAPKIEHQWRLPGNSVRLDVLPITEADLARGQFVSPESEHVMNIAGFDLAFGRAVKRQLKSGLSIDVAPVPVLVVLKMAAWLDRPTQRERDLEDLGFVLSEYLASGDERRWEDDRLLDGTDFADQPALAVGLDVAQILEPHHRAIVNRFLDVLADTESVPSERFARAIAPGGRERQSIVRSRVDAFRRGLSAR